ncbi:MAG: hypothetical protein COV99_10180 [Bacteroidetes bacterium CG12_big_fil_rev_8_21_14_0_65_60_17]|nr:MAG: hypothetical protein COV99_10180 [Bacteroidetes bacterium CG12_big_fil_rev_8_21_14_0_65_60_17]
MKKLEGTLSYQDLEGGFWGLTDAQGNRYVLLDGLPDSMKKDGMPVLATIEPAHVLGTAMWGIYVHVLSIEPVRAS